MYGLRHLVQYVVDASVLHDMLLPRRITFAVLVGSSPICVPLVKRFSLSAGAITELKAALREGAERMPESCRGTVALISFGPSLWHALFSLAHRL